MRDRSSPSCQIAEYPLASRQTETASLISNGIFALKRKSKTVNGTKVSENTVDSMAELNVTMTALMIQWYMMMNVQHLHPCYVFNFFLSFFFVCSIFVLSLRWWLKRFSELSLQIDTVYYPSIKVITCKCVTIFINSFCYGTHTSTWRGTHIDRANRMQHWMGAEDDRHRKNLFCNSWKIHVIFCWFGISP